MFVKNFYTVSNYLFGLKHFKIDLFNVISNQFMNEIENKIVKYNFQKVLFLMMLNIKFK